MKYMESAAQCVRLELVFTDTVRCTPVHLVFHVMDSLSLINQMVSVTAYHVQCVT
ncbi:hypothetical protein Z043_124484, partial [Scleropages formosus]